MASSIELEESICPYIVEIPELQNIGMTNTTLKGCLHQPTQETSVKKFRSYARCHEAGYRTHFKKCSLYMGAKKLGL